MLIKFSTFVMGVFFVFASMPAAALDCKPGERLSLIPLPKPRPNPDGPGTTPGQPTPEPKPEPKPPKPPTPQPVVPPPPTPPPMKDEPADPESLNIPILDQALEGVLPKSLLPYWHGYPWRKVERPLTWTGWLYEHLDKEGRQLIRTVPKDKDLFCPNYPQLSDEERKIFWMKMISVIAELESTYNHRKVYHSVRVQPGLYSIGMMMLSLPSSTQKRFGCSMIKSNDDLFDWRKNLTCAVKIMTYYYSEDQKISGRTSTSKTDSRWMGLARYWEPFRDGRYRQEGGEQKILLKIKQKRRSWLTAAEKSSHPAYADEALRKSGEKDIERIARLLNTLPFCLTGAESEFAPEPPPAPPAGMAYVCLPE